MGAFNCFLEAWKITFLVLVCIPIIIIFLSQSIFAAIQDCNYNKTHPGELNCIPSGERWDIYSNCECCPSSQEYHVTKFDNSWPGGSMNNMCVDLDPIVTPGLSEQFVCESWLSGKYMVESDIYSNPGFCGKTGRCYSDGGVFKWNPLPTCSGNDFCYGGDCHDPIVIDCTGRSCGNALYLPCHYHPFYIPLGPGASIYAWCCIRSFTSLEGQPDSGLNILGECSSQECPPDVCNGVNVYIDWTDVGFCSSEECMNSCEDNKITEECTSEKAAVCALSSTQCGDITDLVCHKKNNFNEYVWDSKSTLGPESDCNDGFDNNCNGLTDCVLGFEDPGCDCGGPPPPPCQFTDAYWSHQTVAENTQVTLTVEGTNCNDGESVVFDLAEVDCLGTCHYNDIDIWDTGELNTKEVTATFSSGQAIASWTAEWVHDDNNSLGDDNPEYVFTATLVSNTSIHIDDSGELKVTKCVPKTCVELGKECDSWPDECGGTVDCGDCPLGQHCEGTGTCVDDEEGTTLCSDYNTPGECATYTQEVAQYSNSLYGIICGDISNCSNPSITEWNNCSCKWDTSCTAASITVNCPKCGNGKIEPGETCDGDEWGDLTPNNCNSFDSFTGGVLDCYPPGHTFECHFNTTSCTPSTSRNCGNGIAEGGEECDFNDWGLITDCSDFNDFGTGGSLLCDGDCMFDTSLCNTQCSWERNVTNNCDEEPKGFWTYIDEATWTGEGEIPDWCKNKPPETLSCPAQIQLSFFNIYTLIAALVVVTLIYFLLNRKKKR